MKLAIVTGGTRGIGFEISKRLKEDGFQVVASYSSNDKAALECEEQIGIPTLKWSVADYEECTKKHAEVIEKWGNVAVLVNNAGITRDNAFHKMASTEWQDVIDVNLTGAFNMCHTAWAGMRSAGFGRIINISSINGQKGQFGQANYSAAKAGLLGLTRALAQEGGAKGITVNAICPGYVDTEMIQTIPDNIRDKIKNTIPVGRFGQPDDIARMVAFLADDASSFITGATFTVNGGQYIAS